MPAPARPSSLKFSHLRLAMLFLLSVSLLLIVKNLSHVESEQPPTADASDHKATFDAVTKRANDVLSRSPLASPPMPGSNGGGIYVPPPVPAPPSPGPPPAAPAAAAPRPPPPPPPPPPPAPADPNMIPPHGTFLGETHRTSSPVTVFVLSFYSDLAARQTIRETWASGHENVYFVIGVPCPIPTGQRDEYFCVLADEAVRPTPEEQADYDAECAANGLLVDEEQRVHHDLIRISDVTEAYRHLPHKLKAAYQWGILNTQSKFFVKTDDDSFVRVDTLSLELLTSYQADTPTLIGAIKPHAIVDHTGARTSGRNKELPEYKPDVYPPWAAGNNGHAVSRPIAQYVSDKRYDLFEYQGEDTSLGIWLDESPLKGKVKFVTSNRFSGSLMTWEGKCEDPEFYSIGHNISPETMRKCFALMDEKPGASERLRGFIEAM
ncbi:hypothetical protein TeGR_g11087 [Tetraparma gracilis]|uniref:Hexosyltransferase n=1 Tax=Tetraparma gracilis TaxID=2962635 RepID=A0ABQ6N2B9_9STRA|nr:hypothetical protein TeGR_g11087 [Tetraparma gracilis]